jgi:rod shape-determining protein MreC
MRETVASPGGARVSALGLRALVLAAVSVAIMVIDYRQQHLKVLRSALQAAVYPLQVVVQSPLAGWDWARAQFATRTSLIADNARLSRELDEDRLRLQRLEAVEQENVRLRALVQAAPRVPDQVLLAEILRLDVDPYRQRVLINRGTNDGVRKGQAVIDADGVFGQVTNVGPFSAEVLLISDAAHALPVQISRNGLRTIADGTGDPRRLTLPYLPRNADVKVDDVLLSSGLGGVFPAGYPVGKVTEVRRDPSQPLAVVSAEPAAALDRDRNVLLVQSAQPLPAPPAEPAPGKPPSKRRDSAATAAAAAGARP